MTLLSGVKVLLASGDGGVEVKLRAGEVPGPKLRPDMAADGRAPPNGER